MQNNVLAQLLVLSGILVFIFALSFDLFFEGSVGIGFQQLVGMTLGLFIIFIGLRQLILLKRLKWDWILFVFYLSGILVFGMRPGDSYHFHQNNLFGIGVISKRDLALNIAGFIPFGFLMLSLLKHYFDSCKDHFFIVVVAFFGFSISLIIESIQYFWIPGRFSSAYDLATNTFGSGVGAICYVVFKKIQINFN